MERHANQQTLARLRGALAADPSVRAVYLGGSLMRGDGDAVSDVDLWVEGDGWTPARLGELLLAGQRAELSGVPFWHGVAADGTLVDVLFGPAPWPGYAPLPPVPPEPAPLGEAEEAGLATEFWINTYKHRKPLARGLDGMVVFGLHHDRMFLLRAWALAATGEDPGPGVFSIHGLSSLVRDYVTPDRLRLLGVPTSSRAELVAAIQVLRDAFSEAVPGGSRLERLVRSSRLG